MLSGICQTVGNKIAVIENLGATLVWGDESTCVCHNCEVCVEKKYSVIDEVYTVCILVEIRISCLL